MIFENENKVNEKKKMNPKNCQKSMYIQPTRDFPTST